MKYWALLGSGSGKSTFGKTLIGLHERTAGEAFLNDVSLPAKFSAADHLTFSRSMQMIFQDPYASLNPRMTVLDIVGEGPFDTRRNTRNGERQSRHLA